jgi:hypothetical protein
LIIVTGFTLAQSQNDSFKQDKEGIVMTSRDSIYRKFEDETGEEIYCPIDTKSEKRVVKTKDIDDCVEATTVGRYSGHLNVIETDE